MNKASDQSIQISENDQLRSDFIRHMVKKPYSSFKFIKNATDTVPKTIVQFWDDSNYIPADVQQCIKTWRFFEDKGFEHIIFNEHDARVFISEMFSQNYVEAFDRCYHPAMKSDYFRLCFIFIHGGCYIDADDAYNGTDIELYFKDDRLKLQPLCYDIDTNTMIKPSIFMNPNNHSENWIYYFNNNPLIARPGNPIIKYALERATKILIKNDQNNFPELQSTTGPGNLTASLVALVSNKAMHNVLIISDWDTHAQTIWLLDYRKDNRNWRLSNKKEFSREILSS